MAKKLIYTPDGKPVEVEAVDAVEYVERCGYTHELPPPVDEKPAKAKKGEEQPPA